MSKIVEFYCPVWKYKAIISYLYRENGAPISYFPLDMAKIIIKFAKQTYATIDNSDALEELEMKRDELKRQINEIKKQITKITSSDKLFKCEEKLQEAGHCFHNEYIGDIINDQKVGCKIFRIYCDVHECNCNTCEHVSKYISDSGENEWLYLLDFDENTIDEYEYTLDGYHTIVSVPILYTIYPVKSLEKEFVYLENDNRNIVVVNIGKIVDNLIINKKTEKTIGTLDEWDSLKLFVIDEDPDEISMSD